MRRRLAGLALGCLSTGCAAITAGNYDTLQVTSRPSGADVRVNGQTVARTPARVELPRRLPSTVEVALAGHGVQQCDASLSAGGGYVVGDVGFCLLFPLGCAGFIVDASSGAWNRLNHPACEVRFDTAPSGATATSSR